MSTQRIPDLIRRFSVLIALFWLGLAVVTNVFVPQLETVAESHNVSLSPHDAPSLQAAKRIGHVFDEFDSDSSAMIVLEEISPSAPTRTTTTTGSFESSARTPSTCSTSRISGVIR